LLLNKNYESRYNYHRIRNTKGDFLLAQRGFLKSKWPWKRSVAVAGTVDVWETYDDNIYKEAEEEIGLTGVLFKKEDKVRKQTPNGNYFCQYYSIILDRSAGKFILEEFAGIATISNLLSFQFKERKHIILFFLISVSCITIHYILLWRIAAATVLWLSILRFFIAYKSTSKYWIYIFILAFILSTLLLFKDSYDFILLLASSLITIAAFQKNDLYLRIWMMVGTTIFISYNLLIWSPIWVLLESVFLWSNFIWYYRHYIKN